SIDRFAVTAKSCNAKNSKVLRTKKTGSARHAHLVDNVRKTTKRRQRPVAQGLSEGLPFGRDAHTTHHDAAEVRPNGEPRQTIRCGRQCVAGEKTNRKLKAFKYYDIPSGDIGLAGIVIEPT
ncbi:MAG: hypothetical protein WB691_01710, partial [Pseudolabrys sp.]